MSSYPPVSSKVLHSISSGFCAYPAKYSSNARVTLAGAVLNELFRYLEEGAEILSAKIHVSTIPLRFDALAYRLSGLKLEPVRNEHWTIDLDQRLEQIAGVFETLDGKYAALKEKMSAVPEPGVLEAAGSQMAEAAEAS